MTDNTISKIQKDEEEKNSQPVKAQKSAEEIEKELENAKMQIQSLTEALKRALADLANFKKRTEEEKKNFIEFAASELLREILQIIDNFDRAFAHIPENLKGNEWIAGVQQIEKQLRDMFENQGVTEMPALEKPIDPNFHDALLTGKGPKNIVIEVLEKGYMLGGKVLRHAKVKVGDGTE
ncbi:nucleotide exchange factor GrpE [Candidatus Peregrinibacteria bacterium]|nr:nucleotide exchange factor GrpE [Candidatus Peregrinibacteria bacterium]